MSVQQVSDNEAAAEGLIKTQLAFAQSIYSSSQELNRAMDYKANFLITAVGLLTTALGIFVSGAISTKVEFDWPGILRVIAIVLMLAYLLTAFSSVYEATRVYQALPNSLRPDTDAPGLMFPLMLLARFQRDGKPSEDAYLERLSGTSLHDLLHDYSNQIVEISNIYRYKQAQINRSIQRFQWLSILWVLLMLLLIAIYVFLPRA